MRGGTGAVHHQLRIAQFAVGQVAGIDQAGSSNDGGAVLVVMEHRNVHQFAQPLLDDETFRRLDVFQVDAAEAAQEPDGVDEFVDVLGAEFQIDAVDIGEALEQRDLALHHRFRCDRAKIAQSEDGGAVGDDCDHVALGGVVVGQRLIARDVQARFRDAGRIGQRQVARGGDRLGDAGLQLARPAALHRQRLFGGDVRGSGIDAAVSHGGFPCKQFSTSCRPLVIMQLALLRARDGSPDLTQDTNLVGASCRVTG